MISAIERVAAAQTRLLGDSAGVSRSSDLALLQREIERLSRTNVHSALEPHGLPSQTATIATYVAQLRFVPELVARDDPTAAIAVLRRTVRVSSFQTVIAALPAFNCDNRETTVQTSAPDPLTSGGASVSASDTRSELMRFEIGVTVFGLAIIVAALVFFIAIYIWRKRWIDRRDRRGKRYVTNLAVFIRVDQISGPARVLDISCRGAKLRCGELFAPVPGQQILICFETNWRRAHVSWSNQHYCGVQFAEPLSIARVEALVAQHDIIAPTRAPDKKTAPIA